MPDARVPRFVKALAAEDLRREGKKACRVEGRSIALFWADGNVYACDNPCPHQGYPLAQGDIAVRLRPDGSREYQLTCNWHNWKFSLPSGQCVLGGESVRAYPVRLEGEDVLLDMSGPGPEEERQRLFKSFRKAMAKAKTGRMARDAVRLLQLGTPPRDVLREAVLFGAARAEEGWDHGLCAATDAFQCLNLYGEEEQIFPLMQALAAVAEPNLRREPRRGPEAAPTGGSAGELREKFLALVEDENAEEAESLFRAALPVFPEAPRWLAEAASRHWLDGGHALIYLQKALELSDILGSDDAAAFMPGMAPSIVFATREDKLPPMRATAQFLQNIPEEEWGDAFAKMSTAAPGNEATEALTERLLGADLPSTHAFLWSEMRRGLSMERFCDALVMAAAERMLAFDVAVELDAGMEESWFDVTHLLTASHALRHLWCRLPNPALPRNVFYIADALRASGGVVKEGENPDMPPARDETALLAGLADSLRHRYPSLAAGSVKRWFEAGLGAQPLLNFLMRHALSDPAARHIHVMHMIKTTRAACREHAELAEHPEAWKIPAAAARFMASPLAERGVVLSTRKGLDFLNKIG